MIREVSSEKLSSFIIINDNNPFRKYYVYEIDKEIIGYFILDIIYDRIELVDIFVKKEKRNNKIGSNMLQYMINFAVEHNFLNITLEVKRNNQNALKLYTKYGFKVVALRKGYYNGEDAMLMELIL